MCSEAQIPTQTATKGKDDQIRTFPLNFKLQMFPTDVILSEVIISAEVETFSINWNRTNMWFCMRESPKGHANIFGL